ncbi:MAG: hypothetical protein QGF59_10885 [Pirellulaceae bacterium]|nr:hypothetical protein [Pirellulaceae bacterium]
MFGTLGCGEYVGAAYGVAAGYWIAGFWIAGYWVGGNGVSSRDPPTDWPSGWPVRELAGIPDPIGCRAKLADCGDEFGVTGGSRLPDLGAKPVFGVGRLSYVCWAMTAETVMLSPRKATAKSNAHRIVSKPPPREQL